MRKIIFYPSKNIMHTERVISIEFHDDDFVDIKTQVELPLCRKGDIRHYTKYPLDSLSLRISE